jgi:hypothetical protein
MFLPNTDSFILIRGSIFKFSFPIFSPNTDSFVLVRETKIESDFVPEAESVVDALDELTDSFVLVQKTKTESNFVPEAESVVDTLAESTDSEESKIKDHSKRNFLKVAGIAGAGLIASQFSPTKAHAFIMGSSPTTGVVGVKDSTNVRINPATEETLDEVLKTSDLTFDAGSLQVKVTSLPGSDGLSSFSDSGDVAKSGLVDGDRHVQVDVLSSTLPSSASTETTLQTVSFGGFKFTIHLVTVGSIDYLGEAAIGSATSSAVWRIKKIDSTTGTSITWAGTGTFDQVWDNYASLTYS